MYFLEGPFYLSVYGQCTELLEDCWNITKCAPCANLYNATFDLTWSNITINTTANTIVLPEDPSTVSLNEGNNYAIASNTVYCNAYTYFKINVTAPCADLMIDVMAVDMHDSRTADIYVVSIDTPPLHPQ